ncbi:MAG: SpoVR family protein [Gammaproteobacteria bacterium]
MVYKAHKKNKRKNKLLSESAEWSFELLEKYDEIIGDLALNKYKLEIYPNQIELISAQQMMDNYSSLGMPLRYYHWSFGKQYLNIEKRYKRGSMGLAYEMVINSNPCISYLLEENTMALQAIVIAHACYGHNSFFKCNYLFQTWTSADAIIDYLLFAKNYIASCEEKYGIEKVEELLDACHALMQNGVDRYKRPAKLSTQEEQNRQEEREIYLQTQVNQLWRTIPRKTGKNARDDKRFPSEPEENILYFLEKHAPLLEPWQREIIRIVRKIAQYFYPQRQTKVMNEGWATFWHYTLINDLYELGYVNDSFMLEFLHVHTDVLSQPAFDSKYYSGINPYTLGFAIFKDLRRICENPTAEDKTWFPDLVNTDWVKTLDFAMRNFKDESFIAQFLSPKVIRDLKLFHLLDDDRQQNLQVRAIHDENGYHDVRQTLASMHNSSNIDPNIQIYSVDKRGDRSMTLRHYPFHRQPIEPGSAQEVLKHLYTLWGFPVKLESCNEAGEWQILYQCGEALSSKKSNNA